MDEALIVSAEPVPESQPMELPCSEDQQTQTSRGKSVSAKKTPILLLSDSDDDTEVVDKSRFRPKDGVPRLETSSRSRDTLSSVKQEFDWWDKELARQKKKEEEELARERKLKEMLDISESQKSENEAFRQKLEVLQLILSSQSQGAQDQQ